MGVNWKGDNAEVMNGMGLKEGIKFIQESSSLKGQEREDFINKTKLSRQDPYITLGNLAREKYQKFKETGIPLENKHIEDVKREGAQFKMDEAASLGRNTAIQSLGPIQTTGQANPHQMIVGLDRRRQVMGNSSAEAANAGANAQRTNALQKKVGLVNLGRGIQSKGSQMMVNSTSIDVGRQIAERNAAAAAKGARQGAIGTVAGTAAGYGLQKYGSNKGWWD